MLASAAHLKLPVLPLVGPIYIGMWVIFASVLTITSTTEAAERLQTLLQNREHEVFGVLFLDSQHRVLAFEELFRGTLDSASIYPREVVKRALLLNSGAVIAVHNHPSGDPEPSHSDRVFTQALKEALALVDVRLLDHLVVGAEGVASLAERGLL
ncbi:DNA repair protein RadC [Aeromonas jandaei]